MNVTGFFHRNTTRLRLALGVVSLITTPFAYNNVYAAVVLCWFGVWCLGGVRSVKHLVTTPGKQFNHYYNVIMNTHRIRVWKHPEPLNTEHLVVLKPTLKNGGFWSVEETLATNTVTTEHESQPNAGT